MHKLFCYGKRAYFLWICLWYNVLMTSSKEYTVVNVAINRPLFREFAYKVNAQLGPSHIGSRVTVNFANQEMVGIITEINPKLEFDENKLKTAILLDEKSFLTDDVLKTLFFGSSYYHYPLGQCFNVALPKILRDGGPFDYEVIPALELKENIDEALISKIRSKEQLNILELLKDGPIRRSQLRERGFLSSQENALIKKGLVSIVNLKIENLPFTHLKDDILKETPPEPNIEQHNAIVAVTECEGFKTFLLNGITGSGKTEVYLRIIENVLKKGKAVLILVPEIALTPQTFDRFYRRFKVPVSSMHSALSDRERLDAYLDMAKGRSGILIGTRTALFTPINNLGLIVIDEEHDSSFKQNDTFRYHARTLAITRAKINNCPIVLGSATPSLESFYNVRRGLFEKLDLKIRAGGARLPDFELIDLTKEPLTDGFKTGISETLEKEIGEETVKGNQVLLFLNRRGYSHHLVCHMCGHVFVCPHCDNLLTVHKKEQVLSCHVCENSIRIPNTCPQCGSDCLVEHGFGTEQVSEFLKLRYPDVGVERIDRDCVTSKSALEQKISRIRKGESQIMLGTQMLAKGHDFPDVTLVGIIDIDSGLFSDDFRALENTAQLLTQVAGRSGRGFKRGRVIIQTHHKDNLLLNKLIDPNFSYLDVASDLLETRKKMMLPPYSNQAFLLCNSSDRNRAHNFLLNLSYKIGAIKDNYANLAISPVLSDKMEKVQNRYHFNMLVSAVRRETLKAFLMDVRAMVAMDSLPQDVRFAIEVDPINMY